jgi:hypothetical protein
MAMISESDSTPNRVFNISRNTSKATLSLPNGRQRQQFGYRTAQMSPEELAGISGASISGNVVSLIAKVESADYSPASYGSRASRSWPVHDRDYTETVYKPSGLSYSWDSLYWSGFTPLPVHIAMNGAFGIHELRSGFMPAVSIGNYSNEAAAMLRNSRPPSLAFDLARFAGEQREAPLLFKMANYMPRTKKELGGSVLNYLFGIKPTGSDLGKLAELVLRSDEPINSLLAGERIREKKSSSRVILKDSGGVDQLSYGSEWASALGGTQVLDNKVGMRFAYILPYGGLGNGTVNGIRVRFSYTRKQLLKTFSTWEYFVPRPMEIDGRLSSYREKAKLLLSSGKLSEATVWELTPWTWLSDWFVDIGGLLRYQRDVANNQIVASACGYSIYEEFFGQLHYADFERLPVEGTRPYSVNVKDTFTPAQASIQWRRHTRRGGNPYSIGPDWNLSSQQWGILGALGLARGTGVPFNKSNGT